jgi:hypothetical protein
MKRFAAICYLLVGLVLTWMCWQSIMMAVWGAKTHWLQYVGLFSALTLSGGALALLITGEKGQKACALGMAGLALMMVPAATEIVPADGLHIKPVAYVIFGAFVGLAVAIMFYPERLRWARTISIGLAVAMLGTVVITAGRRWQDGEFNRPVIIGFHAERSTAPLDLPPNAGPGLPADLLPAALRAEIARTGVGGRLRWTGMVSPVSRATQMLVIVTGPIPAAQPLPYPKKGTVVYVWNGERWATIPEGAACYTSHATVLPDGTISRRLAGGGEQRFGLLHLPAR